MRRFRGGKTALGAGLIALLTLVPTLVSSPAAGPAGAATSTSPEVTQNLSFTTSDGVVLHATLAGWGDFSPRPLIIEDSPYAPNVNTLSWLGPQYNTIELQWRGTGLSTGSLDTTGALDQSDLSQFLGWACTQPWSDGQIGLYGFSASAIIVYNAMHLQLPCVKATALMAGTVDLYRDLLYIGGIPNIAPGAYVETAIGAETLINGGTRFEDEPKSIPDTTLGYITSPADVLANTTEDAFWQERTFQGDADQIPILADTSFYDVEPRGPFMAYNATKQYGSHLLVYGAHDGSPAGTPGPFPQYKNWFDHYLLGQDLSADNTPPVSLYLSNGSREQFKADNVTHLTGTAWPLPGTQWTRLYLSSAKTGSVTSFNGDGTLQLDPATTAKQSYPFIPSDPTEVDVHTMAVIAGDGLDQAAKGLPALTDMQLSGPTSLTYTTPPLTHAVTAVGPASLDVYMSSTEPVTDLYVVVADVWPNGTAYPVATGQLRTNFPGVIPAYSEVDAAGDIVDPYTDFLHTSSAKANQVREYHVEILPIGNTFEAGHRLRVYILGTPLDQLPSLPGVNTVDLGGVTGTRLILPTVGDGLSDAGLAGGS